MGDVESPKAIFLGCTNRNPAAANAVGGYCINCINIHFYFHKGQLGTLARHTHCRNHPLAKQ